MQQSYWSQILSKRVHRRRALVAVGGFTTGAAFLAACGGGESGDRSASTNGDSSGLLTQIQDTSDKAKFGGRYVYPARREPLHFDGQAQGQVQLNVFNGLTYESLVRNKPGVGESSTFSEVLPNLAESWEVSPDKTTVTFKLRQGVKWHNRPPVNARAFDAEDVAASWKRYETAPTPNNKSANSNNVNPNAPVMSMTAPDPQTVVLKLKEPASYIYQRLASMVTGEMGSVYPREAGTDFDPKKDQIGTGAWMLDHFTPSVELVYRRNPEYWDKTGYFDEIVMPVLGEYSTRLAQFKTGALSSELVSAEDILTTKREVPALSLYAWTATTNSTGAAQRFGWLPIGGKPSPFLDIRVRRALSMAQDREAYIDAFSSVSRFEADGLPVDTYYYTTQGYVPEWTLDPRNEGEFGENARYFELNMDEAQKLISAAKSAYPGGDFPGIQSHSVTAVFGPVYTQECETMDGYARALGFNVTNQPLDYNLDYLPKFITQEGQFEGILYGIGAVTSPDMTDYYLWRFYFKTGATSGQLGFGGPNGSKGDKSGDPEADSLIAKAAAEFSTDARREIIHDLQRYLSGKQYAVMRPGFADSFLMAWPAIRNFATFQGDSRVVGAGALGLHQAWFDTTQAHG
jgi:ABC-type transport system substrate-binding protein